MNPFQKALYDHISSPLGSKYPKHVRNVAASVAYCRTNAMRGRVYSCPNNHFSVFMRESCNNRHCPNCQEDNKFEWNIKVKEKVTNSPHFHLVFKLPSFVYTYIIKQYQEFIDILFYSASKTIEKIISYSLDNKPSIAFFSVLHTHGTRLQLHPHLHVVLNSVCLSKNKDKIFFLDESLFSLENFNSIYYQILRKEFSKLQKNHFQYDNEFLYEIKAFEGKSLFYSRKYNSPFPIIDYLSKSIKGNSINLDEVSLLEDGSFNIKRNNLNFTFSQTEFVNRFIKLIIPNNLKSVRYSGFYSSASTDSLRIVKEFLSETNQNQDIAHIPILKEHFSPIHQTCPICKAKMVLIQEVDEFKVPNIIILKFGKDPPTERLFTELVA
jgi:hypothetical protein